MRLNVRYILRYFSASKAYGDTKDQAIHYRIASYFGGH